MTDHQPRPADDQSGRFLLLYALAAGGGSASYAPFLTLILPGRASEIAGDLAVPLLSSIAFVGAIAASVASIVFGWLSDRTRQRRGWIVCGLFGSGVLLVLMGQTRSIPLLLVLIAAWQVTLNMMLNPLTAWAGDCVPDHQKGTLGGLLAFAPALGALVGAIVTIPDFASANARLVLIALVAAAMVLPAVMLGNPRPMPQLMKPAIASGRPDEAILARDAGRRSMPAWRMWLARLLVQIAEAALFAFLLLWLRQRFAAVSDNFVAAVFTGVLIVAIPIALGAGRWSDRANRPMRPLIAAALVAMLGLLAMALAGEVTGALAGYVVFGAAAAVFLALHGSQTLRVLPSPEHRGRDLGIFNLTNTIPALIMPGLTLAVVPRFGFESLFLVLAALVGGSAALLALSPRG